MSGNPLLKQARTDLCLPRTPGGCQDVIVWEHSHRVFHLVEQMASLPELRQRSVDRAALAAAALYHDAGWVLQARSGEIEPCEMLVRPATEEQKRLAADLLAERSESMLSKQSASVAQRAILQMKDRHTGSIEARILAEADNLDEIGPQAVQLLMRKQLAEGKTLTELIAAWDRQAEYGYWEARLNNGFQFESIRAVARHRFDLLQRFMNDLRSTLACEEFQGAGVAFSAGKSGAVPTADSISTMTPDAG